MCKNKIDIIDYGNGPSVWDKTIRTPRMSIQMPATVKLRKKVKIPYTIPRFQKRALFNRDGWACQYCSKKISGKQVTIDHVIPKSKGGQTTWSNCVTACQTCNTIKRDLTPEQAGLKLKRQPVIPNRIHFLSITLHQTSWHPDWAVFINLN
jgi:5-methylcytosine-specific restriction endonuclease McrA